MRVIQQVHAVPSLTLLLPLIQSLSFLTVNSHTYAHSHSHAHSLRTGTGVMNISPSSKRVSSTHPPPRDERSNFLRGLGASGRKRRSRSHSHSHSHNYNEYNEYNEDEIMLSTTTRKHNKEGFINIDFGIDLNHDLRHNLSLVNTTTTSTDTDTDTDTRERTRTIPDSLMVQFFHNDQPIIYYMKHSHLDLDNSFSYYGNKKSTSNDSDSDSDSDSRSDVINSNYYYWYGENDDRDSDNTLNIQIIDGRIMGHASVFDKTYSFMTVVDVDSHEDENSHEDVDEDDGGGIDILVQEVDTAALPQEIESKINANDDDNDNNNDDDNNDNEYENTITKTNGGTDRSLLDQDGDIPEDNGDRIDLLCLYTREALEGLCNKMKGNNCDERYSLWEDAMKDKCMFAVQQTVSVFHSFFKYSIDILFRSIFSCSHHE